jgi:hypothetical protein
MRAVRYAPMGHAMVPPLTDSIGHSPRSVSKEGSPSRSGDREEMDLVVGRVRLSMGGREIRRYAQMDRALVPPWPREVSRTWRARKKLEKRPH